MRADKIHRYRELFKNAHNRKMVVIYKRKRDNVHTLYGDIIKIRKASLILLIGGEEKVNIGYRRICNSLFIDSCNNIKYKLYYKHKQ